MAEHQLFIIAEKSATMDEIWEIICSGVAEFQWIPGWEQVINNPDQISVFAVLTYFYTKKDLIKICRELGKVCIVLTAEEILNHAICQSGGVNGISENAVKDFLRKTAPIELTEENLNMLLEKVSKDGLSWISYRELCALDRFSEIKL